MHHLPRTTERSSSAAVMMSATVTADDSRPPQRVPSSSSKNRRLKRRPVPSPSSLLPCLCLLTCPSWLWLLLMPLTSVDCYSPLRWCVSTSSSYTVEESSRPTVPFTAAHHRPRMSLLAPRPYPADGAFASPGRRRSSPLPPPPLRSTKLGEFGSDARRCTRVVPNTRRNTPVLFQSRDADDEAGDDGSDAVIIDEHDDVPTVLCVGETLWDSLPSGMYLGGAPTNVACHLSMLGLGGGKVAVASCLGRDRLGRETLRRLRDVWGLDTSLVQFVDTLDDGEGGTPTMGTGLVVNTVDPTTGDCTNYEFDTPAAWDCLSLSRDARGTRLEELVRSGKVPVVVMGTICGRLHSSSPEDDAEVAMTTSGKTLESIRRLARADSVVFDVNLRPPWYEPSWVLRLARGDDDDHNAEDSKPLALIKVNEDELCEIEDWLASENASGEGKEGSGGNSIPCPERPLEGDELRARMEFLGERTNANRVCVTRGPNGAALLCRSGDDDAGDGIYVERDGFSYDGGGDTDTVGAGDSFLAALVRSLFVERDPPSVALERGCALGGYVAGCRGATPDHEGAPDELKEVFTFTKIALT